jgi:hypothetical protein
MKKYPYDKIRLPLTFMDIQFESDCEYCHLTLNLTADKEETIEEIIKENKLVVSLSLDELDFTIMMLKKTSKFLHKKQKEMVGFYNS